MSNPGNSGKRYRLVVLQEVHLEAGRILHVLACGHTFTSSVYSETTLATVTSYIGTKERCYACVARKESDAVSEHLAVGTRVRVEAGLHAGEETVILRLIPCEQTDDMRYGVACAPGRWYFRDELTVLENGQNRGTTPENE